MTTREDIKVFEKSDLETGKHYTMIEVPVGEKVYGASYVGDEARMAAIKNLTEVIMRKEIGIMEHDIMMQVYKYEEAKNEVRNTD